MKPEIITIIGKSNSGKTTLMEKLIAALSQKGYKIGSVKHAHDGFEMDKKGKDSWRHKHAGASSTLVISPGKIALIKDEDEDHIQKMRTHLSDMDIILAEGFKSLNLPKIEIFRKDGGHKTPIALDNDLLIAFITDTDHTSQAPVFSPDNIPEIAAFLENRYLKKAAL